MRLGLRFQWSELHAIFLIADHFALLVWIIFLPLVPLLYSLFVIWFRLLDFCFYWRSKYKSHSLFLSATIIGGFVKEGCGIHVCCFGSEPRLWIVDFRVILLVVSLRFSLLVIVSLFFIFYFSVVTLSMSSLIISLWKKNQWREKRMRNI